MTLGWAESIARRAAQRRAGDGAAEDVSDAALLRSVAQGQESALAAVYQRHGSALAAYVTGLTGDSSVAEEVVQDTLMALWRGAARFRGESSVRTWLFAIARRQAAGRSRAGSALDLSVGEEVLAVRASQLPGPEAVALARAEVAELGELIAQLSPLHREVLYLVLVEDLPLREAALVAGVPVGTIKSRLSHARRALASLAASSEWGEGS